MLSKEVADYGEQKGVGITAAKRMAEFLGDDIIKGKGLNLLYIISSRPIDFQRTDRAIPVSIFSSDYNVKKKYLKKWLKES